MTIPTKLYETLKFFKDFGAGIITIITALLLAFGVNENSVTIVTLCISSACQLIILFINTCSKNHWKSKAENGTETEIPEIGTDE